MNGILNIRTVRSQPITVVAHAPGKVLHAQKVVRRKFYSRRRHSKMFLRHRFSFVENIVQIAKSINCSAVAENGPQRVFPSPQSEKNLPQTQKIIRRELETVRGEIKRFAIEKISFAVADNSLRAQKTFHREKLSFTDLINAILFQKLKLLTKVTATVCKKQFPHYILLPTYMFNLKIYQ